MKKVIKNRIYDTETAKPCGTRDNGEQGNFRFCEETLFLKKTGEYFLFGQGGPMSKYARRTGNNSWSGGEQIIPLHIDAAKAWAEEHLDADEYIELFGPVTEDDSRTFAHFSIAADSLELLRRRAQTEGKSMSAILDEMIKGSCR